MRKQTLGDRIIDDWMPWIMGTLVAVVLVAGGMALWNALTGTADDSRAEYGRVPGTVYQFDVDGVPCIFVSGIEKGGLSCGW